MPPRSAPSPQLALPLADTWSPVTVARLGRRSPLAQVRVEVGPRLVRLAVERTARAGRVRLSCEGDAPGPAELGLDVALAPVFLLSTRTAAVRPPHWSLAGSGHLRDPGEFFGHALRWGVEKLAWRAPRGWTRPIQAALSALLREAAAAMARLLEPSLRAATLRFQPRLRAALYGRLLRDERGWLRQALAAAPGPVLYGLALSSRAETEEAGLRLILALKDGQRLDVALAAANQAWRAALLPWALEGSGFNDAARRAFAGAAGTPAAGEAALERAQRLLVRRAGPWVDPALLLLPPPERLIPEDIPAAPRANAAWYEVMKVPGITVPALGLGQEPAHRLAFAAFASRHAEALRAVPAGLTRHAWLSELSALLRDTGREPSRATDPRAVVASVDVEALRRRAPLPVGPFLHPADQALRRLEHAEDRPPPVVVAPEDRPLCRQTLADWTSGGVAVRQLTTLRALRAEGARQHNCVATYDEEVASGRTLVCSVTVDRRTLTLALVRRWGHLRVSEFKGVANRRATQAEWAAITPWLTKVGALR